MREIQKLFFVPEKKVAPVTILDGSPFFIDKDEKGEYVELYNEKRIYFTDLINKKEEFQDIKAYVDDLKK